MPVSAIDLIEGESLHGFVLRLVRKHMLAVATVENETGISLASLTQSPEAVEELAKFAQADRAALMVMAYIRHGHRHLCSFAGNQVATKLLSIAPRKACAACLAESAHHRAIWDVFSVNACPRHEIELLSRCSACDKPLGWAFPVLEQCHGCGHGLSKAPETPAALDDIAHARAVEEAIEKGRGNLSFNLSSALQSLQMDRHARIYREGGEVPRRQMGRRQAAETA